MSATLGASYSRTPTGEQGTRLRSGVSHSQARLPAWKELVAVVAPSCCGKSTAAQTFGGYDLDEVVADASDSTLDTELDEMLACREDGLTQGRNDLMHRQNAIMLQRARRFFATVEPDCNPLVLYVHTAEMAAALDLEVLSVISLPINVVASSPRAKATSDYERRVLLKLVEEQTSANDEYSRRHGLEKSPCTSYEMVHSRIRSLLFGRGVLKMTPAAQAWLSALGPASSEEVVMNKAMAILRDRDNIRWLRASAARYLLGSLGEAAPHEAQQACNHPTWARIVHAAASASRNLSAGAVPSWTEAEWREQFPLGPGHAGFALCNVSDWLEMTGPAIHADGAYEWFRQVVQLGGTGVKYERLMCLLSFGDVLAYVVPQWQELVYRLPLGALPDSAFITIAKEVHGAVRSGLNYLGRELQVKDLTYFTYFDCLAGRIIGANDIEAEIEERTNPQKPKVFFQDGKWSQEEFDKRFREAVAVQCDSMARSMGKVLASLGDQVESFEEFLRHRRLWVKPGAVTGAPKADVYLKVPESKMKELSDVAEEVADMTIVVLKRVRLNKSALFEFPQFVELVQEALADYEPNAFSRYFWKMEPGKEGGRALYPCHLLHYVMVSHILYLVEKAQPMDNSRYPASAADQREDHWLWRESHDAAVHLMLDYANFNETHSRKHMQMMFKQQRAVFAQHHALTESLEQSFRWVEEAFERICIEHEGNLIAVSHGLWSGMRNTTNTNSLANPAYLRVIGEQVAVLTGISPLTSAQTGGDDVAAEARSLYEAVLILRCGGAMGFGFKASKQLIAYKYREFYRLFVDEHGVYGSLCRMFGSAFSGQWSNSVLAKFVEPAAKLLSVVEVARKAGRRARSLSFMEKVVTCAFRKWATDGEEQLAYNLVHGTKATGGLGIPTALGDVLELDGHAEPEERLEVVGAPAAASMELATKVTTEVSNLLAPECAVDVRQLAAQLSEGAFLSAVAQNRGPGVLRVSGSRRNPKLVRRKAIRAEEFPKASSNLFYRKLASAREWMQAMRRAGAKYASLSQAVKPKYRRLLAEKVCQEIPGAEAELVYFWKEELELYGCATYLLTEDYYADVVMLALQQHKCTSDTVSRKAAELAVGLANDGFMHY
uniref:RNA-directed RNA polymerase n=1 Tax=Alternaria alternata chrysovirus 1 TaxID=2066695 RepID=A0A7D5BX67_9VIRU|nr:RNA-dependent RNA polymerase [Alternaria alternata chrysovirus 1]